MATAARALIIIGVLLFAGALAWWYVFYEQFLGLDVKQASECFYYTTDLCALSALAEPISDVPTYSPVLLWLFGGLVALGIVLLAVSPHRH